MPRPYTFYFPLYRLYTLSHFHTFILSHFHTFTLIFVPLQGETVCAASRHRSYRVLYAMQCARRQLQRVGGVCAHYGSPEVGSARFPAFGRAGGVDFGGAPKDDAKNTAKTPFHARNTPRNQPLRGAIAAKNGHQSTVRCRTHQR